MELQAYENSRIGPVLFIELLLVATARWDLAERQK